MQSNLAEISETNSTKLIQKTSSLCRICKNGLAAEIIERDGQIFLQKTCNQHGFQEVILSSDAQWYYQTMEYPAILKAPKPSKPVEQGCPFDCGACSSHQQSVYLPVVPVTSACNLDCPICYTHNVNKNAYQMTVEEFEKTLEVIKRNDPELQIINFTGGEPTLNPHFLQILEKCAEAGIHRITVSTHGLTFLKNEKMLEEMAKLNTRIVLSFNSYEDAVNKKMLGGALVEKKLKVLDLLEKHEVDTTLIPVIVQGLNDHEIPNLLKLLFTRPFIRSLEMHTMTFTGQGGTDFKGGSRITLPDLLAKIETASEGKLLASDFTPSPCAHPLCYQTCYLLDLGTEFIPFARFMSKAQIRELLKDNLYIEPNARTEAVLQEVINDLWIDSGTHPWSETVLKRLKKLLQDLFPSQPLSYAAQQKISEGFAKTIYIHSHMDEENFDMDRVRQCCVGVPSTDGGNIPTCSYNVLYRERDPRFSKHKHSPLNEFTGGQKW